MIKQEGISISQEFALMSRNNHPNIVKFLDFIGECNVLIMEVKKIIYNTFFQ